MPSGPGGASTLFELVLEVPPGPVEGCAGDACLTGERLDVAGAAGRDMPGQQPVNGRSDPLLNLITLFGAECHVIRPFPRLCRSLRGHASSVRARPADASSPRPGRGGWRAGRSRFRPWSARRTGERGGGWPAGIGRCRRARPEGLLPPSDRRACDTELSPDPRNSSSLPPPGAAPVPCFSSSSICRSVTTFAGPGSWSSSSFSAARKAASSVSAPGSAGICPCSNCRYASTVRSRASPSPPPSSTRGGRRSGRRPAGPRIPRLWPPAGA